MVSYQGRRSLMTATISIHGPSSSVRFGPCLSPTPRPKEGFSMILMKFRSKYLGIPRDVML